MSYGEPRYSSEGEFLGHIGLSPDITDRKQVELALKESENKLRILNENLENIVIQRTEQVRALSNALTFAEQRERKRFSYILHEDLQQELFVAKMVFNQYLIVREPTLDPSAHTDIADGNKILESALQVTRILSLELNPPILKTEGLDTALMWLTDHMNKSYGLITNLHIDSSLFDIKGDDQILITQMIRELLSNVVQHSGVLKAEVRAECSNKQIVITVIDKGRGFDPDKDVSKQSVIAKFGLFSVRERLNLIGGELKIVSSTGNGTECTIIYPYGKCYQRKNV